MTRATEQMIEALRLRFLTAIFVNLDYGTAPSWRLSRAEHDCLVAALAAALAAPQAMAWEKADGATVDPDAYYVVQHNGHEWRDFDLVILSGALVAQRLKPDYVRGRPEWIAKIVRPLPPPPAAPAVTTF